MNQDSARILGLGPVTRRLWPVAAAAVAVSLTLAGCGSSGDTASDTSASTAASATTTTAASGSVVALAEAFTATLDDEQKTALAQDYTFANATNWSNLPNALLGGGGGMGGGTMPSGDASGMPSGGPPSGDGSGPPSGAPGGAASATGSSSDASASASGDAGATATSTSTSSGGRVGLQTSTLSDEQWTALEALLKAATGTATNEGYDEVMQHLAADDYLADNGGGSDYGRGNYFIAFLGTPSDSGTWELQFGGHHLAIANTYTDGVLAGATPSFRGIEPFTTVTEDDLTVMPEQQEAAAFAAVIASLTDAEKTTATLSESFNDIVLGPGQDWAFPETPEGVKGSDLTDDQKALVLAAINTYVGDVDDADAATILATYEGQLDDTYVSYTGTGNFTDQGDYIRIDGPQVWIEFSMQNGIVLSGAHPHAVWRDKKADYAGLTS